MAESAEVLEARIRDIAEREKEMLEQGSGSFHARFFWYDSDVEAPPRIIMSPDITPETRPYLPWAVTVLTAVQNDVRELVFLMDGWYARQATKKDGTNWSQGEMEYAVLNNTENADLIGESLTMTVAYADGNMGMASVHYTRSTDPFGKEKVTYDWEASKDTIALVTGAEGTRAEGFFPDLMKEAMAQPKLTKAMHEQFGFDGTEFGLEPWQRDMHTLAVGVKMVLHKAHFPVLIVGRSDAEAELINESMTSGPLSDGLIAIREDQMAEIVQLEEIYAMSDPDS